MKHTLSEKPLLQGFFSLSLYPSFSRVLLFSCSLMGSFLSGKQVTYMQVFVVDLVGGQCLDHIRSTNSCFVWLVSSVFLAIPSKECSLHPYVHISASHISSYFSWVSFIWVSHADVLLNINLQILRLTERNNAAVSENIHERCLLFKLSERERVRVSLPSFAFPPETNTRSLVLRRTLVPNTNHAIKYTCVHEW